MLIVADQLFLFAVTMDQLGLYSNIPVTYIHIRTAANVAALLPNENWLAFVIADMPDKELLHQYASIIIEKKVKWICCSGELHSYADDLFDWAYLEQEKGSISDENFVCADFIEDIHKGFDWALICANNQGFSHVVCFDFGIYSQGDRLAHLLSLLNSGWAPEY